MAGLARLALLYERLRLIRGGGFIVHPTVQTSLVVGMATAAWNVLLEVPTFGPDKRAHWVPFHCPDARGRERCDPVKGTGEQSPDRV